MAVKNIVKIWDEGEISENNIHFLKSKTKEVTFPASPFINRILKFKIDYRSTYQVYVIENYDLS